MAKQRHGINDGYRGAVGTVIGYEWRGRWCLRARPRQVRNPRTERQRASRALFAEASRLASALKGILRVGLRTEALKAHRTECNHFMSINSGCFALEGGALRVDWEALALSQGPVAPVGFGEPALAAEAVVGGDGEGVSLTVPFERNPLHLSSQGDDRVYLCAVCPQLGEGVLSVAAYRRSRAVTLTLPARWQGRDVVLYGFVEDYAGRTSDSVCLGTLAAVDATEQPMASGRAAQPAASPMRTSVMAATAEGEKVPAASLAEAKEKPDRIVSLSGFGSGGRIRTNDLRVMSPTSYHCSTPHSGYSKRVER